MSDERMVELMRYNSKTRKAVIAVAALMVFVMTGSTWAYASQELFAHNEFQVGKYKTEIVEVFEPPASWLPGMDINKDVSIRNDGSVPAFVRVTINQKWLRTADVYDAEGNQVKPGKGEELPLMSKDSNGKEAYAAEINWGPEVVRLGQSAGLATGNMQAAKGKWLLLSDKPDANNNYTLYYLGVLNPKASTPLALDSVRLNGGIQNATIADDTVWDKTRQEWITSYTHNGFSYENARYTLTVTMDSVQAMEGVASEFYTAANVSEQAAISYLEYLGRTEGYAATQVDTTGHKLYFDQVDGKMLFTPVSANGEHWFMSWLNMVPGGKYQNALDIENRSKIDYDLFMQAVPLEQSPQMDALLELISMKVYHGDKLIYDGKASGKEYANSGNNLRNVILLGAYDAGTTGRIRVDLELSKDTPLEYAELISRIDWKFMVWQVQVVTPPPEPAGSPSMTPTPSPGVTPTPTPSGQTPTPGVTITPGPGTILTPTPTPIRIQPPPGTPKTGDESSFSRYMMVMVMCGTLLAACIIFLAKTRKRTTT